MFPLQLPAPQPAQAHIFPPPLVFLFLFLSYTHPYAVQHSRTQQQVPTTVPCRCVMDLGREGSTRRTPSQGIPSQEIPSQRHQEIIIQGHALSLSPEHIVKILFKSFPLRAFTTTYTLLKILDLKLIN